MIELTLPSQTDPDVVQLQRLRSQEWLNRSRANHERMVKYWSEERHHLRVDKKQAKPVDVFDLGGHYIATYPSSRKAAKALFPDRDYHIIERCIRAVRCGTNKSYHGLMFKDAQPIKQDTEPWTKAPKTQRKGYRHKCPSLRKPVRVIFPDGDFIDFQSVQECADALCRKQNSVSTAAHHGTRCRGFLVQFI